MIKTEVLIKHALKDYEISYLFKPYKSFMPTEFSYNKEPVTLDYILIPKKFKFNKLQCITNKVSDHNPLIVEVSPRGNWATWSEATERFAGIYKELLLREFLL